MSILISRYERIQIFGDSIVANAHSGGVINAYGPLITAFRKVFAGGSAINNAALYDGDQAVVPHDDGFGGADDAPPGYIQYVCSGVGGDRVADVLARMAGQIDSKATVMGLAVGINDADDTPPTTSANFLASYTACLNLMLGQVPAARIFCVSICCHGDAVPDDHAADTDRLNPVIQAAMAAASTPIPTANYVDLRTPRNAYEAANNPMNLNCGILMYCPGPSAHPMPNGIATIWTANLIPHFSFDLR
jgi:lysophospholipase L1-like esterase